MLDIPRPNSNHRTSFTLALTITLLSQHAHSDENQRNWQKLESLWNNAITQKYHSERGSQSEPDRKKSHKEKRSDKSQYKHKREEDKQKHHHKKQDHGIDLDGDGVIDHRPWNRYKWGKPHKWGKGGKLGARIEALAERVAQLEAQSSAIILQLSNLELQVSTNTASIETILLRVEEMRETQNLLMQAQMNNTEWLTQVALSVQDLSVELQTQRENLTALILEQSQAIANNEVALRDLRANLLTLSADNIALAQQLQTQTNELQAEIDTLENTATTNTTDIQTQQTALSTLQTSVTTALADYNYLSALYLTLKDLTEQNESQLQSLEQTVNNLSLNGGGTGGNSSIATYTFTDEPDVDDTDHVNALRAFLISTPTVGRWVNIVFTTPATNRTTEICFQDNTDIFTRARDTSNHAYEATTGGSGTYRLNNGDWATTSVMRVQSRNDATVSYVYIGAATPDTAVTALSNFNSVSPIYDSIHQKRYFTVELTSPTTAVYTVGDDRLSACGY